MYTHTHSTFPGLNKTQDTLVNTHFHTELTLAGVCAELLVEQLVSICGCCSPGLCCPDRTHNGLLQPIHEFCCSHTSFRVKLNLWQAVCVLQPLTWMSLQHGLWLTQPWLGSSGSWFWCWSPCCSGSASATAGTRALHHHWRSIWQVCGALNPLLCGYIWRPLRRTLTRTSTLILL